MLSRLLMQGQFLRAMPHTSKQKLRQGSQGEIPQLFLRSAERCLGLPNRSLSMGHRDRSFNTGRCLSFHNRSFGKGHRGRSYNTGRCLRLPIRSFGLGHGGRSYNTGRFLRLPGDGRVVRWSWVNFQCRGVLQFG